MSEQMERIGKKLALIGAAILLLTLSIHATLWFHAWMHCVSGQCL